MKYSIYINNYYLNSYFNEERACEIVNNILSVFKNAVVEIREERVVAQWKIIKCWSLF